MQLKKNMYLHVLVIFLLIHDFVQQELVCKVPFSDYVPIQRVSLPPIKKAYREYQQEYKRDAERRCIQPPEVRNYRQLIYYRNLAKINNHNQNSERKYDMGLNSFTDIEQKQFLRSHANTIYQRETPKQLFIDGPQQFQQISQPQFQKVIPQEALIQPRQSKPIQSQFQQFESNPQAASQQVKKNPSQQKKRAQQSQLQQFQQNVRAAQSISLARDQMQQQIDWTCKTGSVKDQGHCGSCYAFSVIDSIYTNYIAYQNTISELSIQQIISCGKGSGIDGLNGCDGGYMSSVIQYVFQKQIGQAFLYPYSPNTLNFGVPGNCLVDSLTSYSQNKRKIINRRSVNSCSDLLLILRLGTVAVVYDATNSQFYKAGTMTGPQAGQFNGVPNHGVLLVGYHPTHGYKIKNSWGTGWGLQGFQYISESTGVCASGFQPIIPGSTRPPASCFCAF